MATTGYMPSDDSGKADLLDHLAATLPRYTEVLGIADAVIQTLRADAAAFRYVLHATDDMQSYAQHLTALKNLLRDGGPGAGDWPIPPALPEPIPAPVPPGIIDRLSALVAHIKTLTNYTPAIGQDLWIIGAAKVVDPSTWKPVLGTQNKAGHPIITWTKGKASALEIWVDRNDGNGFVLLTISTQPNTADNAPLPAPGTSAVWKYKAIYRYHDEQVGQWSDVISITVGG